MASPSYPPRSYLSVAPTQLFISLLFLSSLLMSSGAYSATLTFVNSCGYPVWPGILPNAGTPQLPTTGFALQPGESNTVSVPSSWSGRLWGRTHCTQDATSGKFTCLTGDCRSSTLECSGNGADPPATLAEFTLNGAGGLDFYDVSLVDGYNLPMLITPQGGSSGNCTLTGCAVDLNNACPSELKVVDGGNGESVACKSACEAFGAPEYCCSGVYGAPDSCKPTSYSAFFKSACPRAYSYAYDDGTSTFTCACANYVITFCPSPTISLKSANGQYSEALAISASSRSTIGGVITVMAAILRLWQLFGRTCY